MWIYIAHNRNTSNALKASNKVKILLHVV